MSGRSTADVLTAKDAAKKLGVGPATLRRHVRAGRIPCWVDPDSGTRRYPVASLDAFLASFAVSTDTA